MIDQASKVRSALAHLDPSDRPLWVKVAKGIKNEMGEQGFDDWDFWSQGAPNYNERDACDVWRSVRPGGRITIATVYFEARAAGWRDDSPAEHLTAAELAERSARQKREAAEAEAARQTHYEIQAVESRQAWSRAKPADPTHPYLARKQVQPHNLRQHASMLTVPMFDEHGTLWNLQRIYPDGTKLFRPGRARGLFCPFGDLVDLVAPATVLICEGWATGATLHETTGYPVLAALNANNLVHVARAALALWPGVDLVICGDDDRATPGNPGRAAATRAAIDTGSRLALPAFGDDEQGTDFNDWHINRQTI